MAGRYSCARFGRLASKSGAGARVGHLRRAGLQRGAHILKGGDGPGLKPDVERGGRRLRGAAWCRAIFREPCGAAGGAAGAVDWCEANFQAPFCFTYTCETMSVPEVPFFNVCTCVP